MWWRGCLKCDDITVDRVHADGSGEAREVYILTSQLGAEKIRPRAIAKGIAEARIDAMIMTLSPAGEPGKIDVARVPQYLYEKLDVSALAQLLDQYIIRPSFRGAPFYLFKHQLMLSNRLPLR